MKITATFSLNGEEYQIETIGHEYTKQLSDDYIKGYFACHILRDLRDLNEIAEEDLPYPSDVNIDIER